MPDSLDNSGVPPLLPESGPPPAQTPQGRPHSARRLLAIVLSLCLGFFLADAVISFADDSLILFCHLHFLALPRVLVFGIAALSTMVVYVLMGVTPLVPKRLFLPLALFYLIGELSVIPLTVYYFSRIQQIALLISLCQVLCGLGVLWWAAGGVTFRWPLVREDQIEGRGFTWGNLAAFLLANVFLLLPGLAVYCALSAAAAVDHFSDGFVTLRPGGMMVHVRKYVRSSDGKTIQLFPMMHVADARFYEKVSQSFPTNSIILLEGVTDERNLLTNDITYKRMASSLGLGEQHEDFKPTRGEMVRADVDVDQFKTNTIDLLNLIMFVHAKGLNDTTLVKVAQYTPPPDFPAQLFDDLLGMRNRHLTDEIQARLGQTDNIIVPWGAAHMPGIAREIQKSGFHLEDTQDFMAIRFRYPGHERSDNKSK